MEPRRLRPTQEDLEYDFDSSRRAALGIPPSVALTTTTHEEDVALAVRNTVRVAVRQESRDPLAPMYKVGQRVYVRSARAERGGEFKDTLWGAVGFVAEAKNYTYRILWISSGHDGGRKGTISRSQCLCSCVRIRVQSQFYLYIY